jgi:hypothetical protein
MSILLFSLLLIKIKFSFEITPKDVIFLGRKTLQIYQIYKR